MHDTFNASHSRFVNHNGTKRNRYMRGTTPRALWLDMSKSLNRGPTPEELRREATFSAMGQGEDSVEAPEATPSAVSNEAPPTVEPVKAAPVFMFIRKAPKSFKDGVRS